MELIRSILPWLQVGLSVVLVALILLQQSEAALGAAFGGGSGENIHRTKRGLEKWIFVATIVIAILFALSALVALFVS